MLDTFECCSGYKREMLRLELTTPEKHALVGVVTLLALSALVIHLSRCNGEPKIIYLLDQVTLMVSLPYLI